MFTSLTRAWHALAALAAGVAMTLPSQAAVPAGRNHSIEAAALPSGFTSLQVHDVNASGAVTGLLMDDDGNQSVFRWQVTTGFESLTRGVFEQQSMTDPTRGTPDSRLSIGGQGQVARGLGDWGMAYWGAGQTQATFFDGDLDVGGVFNRHLEVSFLGLDGAGVAHGVTRIISNPVYDYANGDLLFSGDATYAWSWTPTEGETVLGSAYVPGAEPTIAPTSRSANGARVGNDGLGAYLLEGTRKRYLNALVPFSDPLYILTMPRRLQALGITTGGDIWTTDGSSMYVLSASPVPEPASWALPLIGLGLMAVRARQRNRQA